jgi:hypothetical protein
LLNQNKTDEEILGAADVIGDFFIVHDPGHVAL